ncbi:MAG: PAS domain-containing protein [Gammaproteobacteria bacterium]|nr:PAS domain-containing protein [Gammaproteobacteria bacterium]NIR97894.1 PAS domain-containing protein [Gammaproteobacteria bacterium]NIT63599.1 PAS domain-containing protein [Gammaproteobacteria bacterium]NIV20535.1 PAS domain-containing protein [Gammaproteobacteria bacterium]NIX11129.1 PAS domain-containing protein [Gammaproteobacteria bacterium]
MAKKRTTKAKKAVVKKAAALPVAKEAAKGEREVEFPVVGIGASAGGLEAFIALLKALPGDTGMAFVFVQHFMPGHVSMLSDILARETSMPAVDVADGMELWPDHLYVLAAYGSLSLAGKALCLAGAPQGRERHMPIDFFFRSLAASQGSRAIGIVLSGTASDGTLGLKAIKAAGGITMAQDETSARYDGMPRSAIAAGAVNIVLPPAKLAGELVRIARHPHLLEPEVAPRTEAVVQTQDQLKRIFALLERQFSTDFTYYKHSTIQRRINRRMVVCKVERLQDYAELLEKNPQELDTLYHDILINVTGFFREPEAFTFLAQKVFPELIKDRPAEAAIRVWVPGCSTGEEPYSIAMALSEFMEQAGVQFPMQIFATDIDDRAIAQARAAIYPESMAQDVTETRLRRFFVKVSGGYQVNKAIRDSCVFSNHNVAKDPPFSKLDLISCRNLLIYLGPVLQKRVLPIFHFALKPTGYLMLGSAESIGAAADLFTLMDKGARVYAKKSVETPLQFDFRLPPIAQPMQVPAARPAEEPVGPVTALHREAERLILRKYAPPGVVIDERMQIAEFRGHTGPYLEPAPGQASLNLLSMAREGLVAKLRAAVTQAIEEDKEVRRERLRTMFNGEGRLVNLQVVPLRPIDELRYYLVLFEPVEAPPAPATADTRAGEGHAEEPGEIARLRQELVATKEYLHSVIEQQEQTNEELRCANEEVQSGYEELQTVNDELENRNAELTRINDDMHNLIGSIELALVMVGADLRVRRFNTRAEELLNLIDTDVGRPITDIRSKVELPELSELVAEAVDKVRSVEREIHDEGGHWYAMRIHPYRTVDNRIDGAVVTLSDIDTMKRALESAQAARDFAQATIAAVRHAMLALDKDLVVVTASSAYLERFGVTEKKTVGNLVYRIGNGQWAIPELRARLEQTVSTGEPFDDLLVEHEFEKLGARRMSVSGRRIGPGLERGPLVLMQIEDVTN